MSAPLRIVPLQLLWPRRAHRLLERQWMVNTSGSGWIVLLSGLFEPLFYLVSVQVGFGALIGVVVDGGRTYDYAEFVAPALLASAAMQGAVFESTYNIFFKLHKEKTYDAMLTTPMTVGDVAVGEILNCTFRGSLYSAAFLAIMAALGYTGSWWSLMIFPVSVLLALTFSAVGMAATTFMRSWVDFEFIPIVVVPLFLFSATFYPPSVYGDFAWAVNLSPLYHGVALCRGFNTGDVGVWMLVHFAVLAALFMIGLSITARRIGALLLK